MLDHQEQLQFFVNYIKLHPHWSGLIAFAVSFCEALAVIGTVIPGSITMTAIGILIGANIFHPVHAFAWIISGGLLGDYFSYWVGVRYKNRLKGLWPFKKHPQLLITGEDFFNRHGGKSVIIGRFFGPMRSMVPLVAGMLNMPRLRFISAMIPSIMLWAFVYTLPGILIGALSLQLPPKLALTFLGVALLVSAAIWGTIWLIQNFLKQAITLINRFSKRCWKHCITHSRLVWFMELLCPARQRGYFHQLTRFILWLLVLTAFILLCWQVATQGLLTALNSPLNHFFLSIRGTFGSHLMLTITMIADKHVLLSSALMISLWLFYKKHWRAGTHWLLLNGVTAVAIKAFKFIIHAPRPNGLTHTMVTSSFPSGHVTLFVSFMAFLALLVMQDIHFKRRYIINYIVMGAIFVIMLSRLYLGAHWLTDTIGGIFLGLGMMLFFTLSYRRQKPSRIPAPSLLTITLLVLTVNTSIYATTHFRFFDAVYQLHWPTIITTHHDWWHQDVTNNSLPHYRLNRLGKAAQPFNIQFSGELFLIKERLTDQGWQSHNILPKLPTMLERLQRDPHDPKTPELPLLPLNYQNHPPALLLTKTIKQQQLILRLWKANIMIDGEETHLWLGTINDHQLNSPQNTVLHHIPKTPDSMNATRALTPYLNGFQWKVLQIPADQQPDPIQKLQWDGKILLIR